MDYVILICVCTGLKLGWTILVAVPLSAPAVLFIVWAGPATQDPRPATRHLFFAARTSKSVRQVWPEHEVEAIRQSRRIYYIRHRALAAKCGVSQGP